jgi:hypothetical protein
MAGATGCGVPGAGADSECLNSPPQRHHTSPPLHALCSVIEGGGDGTAPPLPEGGAGAQAQGHVEEDTPSTFVEALPPQALK